MKISTKLLVIVFLLFLCGNFVYAQSDKKKAFELVQKAIKLEDDGNYNEALKLINDAIKLDPNNPEIKYELSYSYYGLKQYDKAISILEELIKKEELVDLHFQLLGNAYDMKGNADKAIEIYKKGLKKFPNSGRLYLEMCVVEYNRGDYDKALSYCEKGIDVDPNFPSNYYWAARLYCNSTEKIWGLLYGEIFVNLERNGKRTEEISKLLYSTYKKGIIFESDTTIAVRLSKNSGVFSLNGSEFKLPFEMVYELITSNSVILEETINLSSLSRIRTKFLELYFGMGHDKNYPNILFDYQKKIRESGNLEAYNYWLLMWGEENSFGQWYNEKKDRWDKFEDWFNKNQIRINKENKFHREKY